jgi:hypothetical protein
MPRKDSRSKSPTFNKPFNFKEAATYKPFVPPKPLPIYNPPMYIPKPTLFDSVKQGFGLGLGSSIGHKVVDSFMGSSIKTNNNNINNKCDTIKNEYNKCMLENKYNDPKDTCYKLEKEYEQCKI